MTTNSQNNDLQGFSAPDACVDTPKPPTRAFGGKNVKIGGDDPDENYDQCARCGHERRYHVPRTLIQDEFQGETQDACLLCNCEDFAEVEE
jgi:hypothetical protein